jgi:hypothetical protein
MQKLIFKYVKEQEQAYPGKDYQRNPGGTFESYRACAKSKINLVFLSKCTDF